MQGAAGITLVDMMQTTTQQTIIIGYNTAGGVSGTSPLFASRLTSAGILDPTWNPDSTSPDVDGVLTYASGTTPEATTLSDAAISINGTIVSIGSSSNTGGHPIVTFVYGDIYVTEVIEQPFEAAAGTTDLTLPGSVSGALALTSLPGSGSITGVPQRMYIYNTTVNSSPNGAVLVASVVSATATVYITQLNSDLNYFLIAYFLIPFDLDYM